MHKITKNMLTLKQGKRKGVNESKIEGALDQMYMFSNSSFQAGLLQCALFCAL